MKILARLFPYTRRLERDYESVRRARRVAEWHRVQEGYTVSAFGDALAVEKTRQLEWGKVTFEEVEILLTACVDYHDALVSLCAADPIRSRVYPIFDKYDIKVLTPSIWNPSQPKPNGNRHLSVITGVTS